MDSTDDEDAECELMLDALHHQLEQVEVEVVRQWRGLTQGITPS